MEADGPPTHRKADGAGKRSRHLYNTGQKKIIDAGEPSGARYREILAAHHEMGFALGRLKSAFERLKTNGAMDRANGSGGSGRRGQRIRPTHLGCISRRTQRGILWRRGARLRYSESHYAGDPDARPRQ